MTSAYSPPDYFPPSYFPPDYFGSAPAAAGAGGGYWTGAYFAASYFGGSNPSPGGSPAIPPAPSPSASGPPVGDAAVFSDLIGVVRSVPPFDQMMGSVLYEVGPRDFQPSPYAWFIPLRWSESLDDDGVTRLRKVWFRLTLVVSGDPAQNAAALHALAAAIADAVDLSTPAGCFANETRIVEASYPDQAGSRTVGGAILDPPLASADLLGTFAYEVTAGARG